MEYLTRSLDLNTGKIERLRSFNPRLINSLEKFINLNEFIGFLLTIRSLEQLYQLQKALFSLPIKELNDPQLVQNYLSSEEKEEKDYFGIRRVHLSFTPKLTITKDICDEISLKNLRYVLSIQFPTDVAISNFILTFSMKVKILSSALPRGGEIYTQLMTNPSEEIASFNGYEYRVFQDNICLSVKSYQHHITFQIADEIADDTNIVDIFTLIECQFEIFGGKQIEHLLSLSNKMKMKKLLNLVELELINPSSEKKDFYKIERYAV